MTKKKSKPQSRQTPSPSVATVKKQSPRRTTSEDGKIDEEIDESFPASDPPSTTPTVGPGSPKP